MVFFWNRAAPAFKPGKVVLFGCSTVVGQPLSLLLKLCPHVEELVCCSHAKDGAVSAMGVAADIAHVDTDARIRFAESEAEWPAAVRDAALVLVCSGHSFDPLREDRDVALRASAPPAKAVMDAIAAADCKANIAVVSSPVNALTPFCAEVLKKHGKFDPRKLFGVTTLDVLRTRKMVAGVMGMNPYDVAIPVVGGRGGVTACPLIAQTGLRVRPEDVMHITNGIQSYGVPFHESGPGGESTDAVTTEVAPPVALGLAYAALDFSVSLLKAQRGDVGLVECSLVESTMRPETHFFASRVQLGVEGVERIFPMGTLTHYEHELIDAAVVELAKDVEAGVAMAASSLSSCTEKSN